MHAPCCTIITTIHLWNVLILPAEPLSPLNVNSPFTTPLPWGTNILPSASLSANHMEMTLHTHQDGYYQNNRK